MVSKADLDRIELDVVLLGRLGMSGHGDLGMGDGRGAAW